MHYKTRKFSRLFHRAKMHLLALLGLFTDRNDRLSHHFIQFNKWNPRPRAVARFFCKGWGGGGVHYSECRSHEPCRGVWGYPLPEDFQIWRLRETIFSTCHEIWEVLNVYFSFVALMYLLSSDHLQDQDVVFIYMYQANSRFDNRFLIWKYQILI